MTRVLIASYFPPQNQMSQIGKLAPWVLEPMQQQALSIHFSQAKALIYGFEFPFAIELWFMVLKNKLTTVERGDHPWGWGVCGFVEGEARMMRKGTGEPHCWGWDTARFGVSKRVQQVASATPPCLMCLICLHYHCQASRIKGL